MNKTYRCFTDAIPDLGKFLGISHLDYLSVGIKQAREYGYEETARWFEYFEERFKNAIEGEWNVVNDEVTKGSEGE